MAQEHCLGEWEARAHALRADLEAILGLKRRPRTFEVRRKPFAEPADATLDRVAELWPELDRFRVPPEQRAAGGFTAERVAFAGVDGDLVGVLRTPKGLSQPAPAVLCLHGHARGMMLGKEITEIYAVPLANAGMITFAPDSLLFGERRRREFDDEEMSSGGQRAFPAERILAFDCFLKGGTVMGERLAEFVRCIDFLADLPEAGPIAVMGHSMGGIHAFWLGALDERVHATVCCAGLLSYRRMAEQGVSRRHGIYSLIPGLLKVSDTPDIVSLIPPRALYAVHAESDLGFPVDGVNEITSRARQVYRRYGAADQLVSKIIPGDHGGVLAPDELADIRNWLIATCLTGRAGNPRDGLTG